MKFDAFNHGQYLGIEAVLRALISTHQNVPLLLELIEKQRETAIAGLHASELSDRQIDDVQKAMDEVLGNLTPYLPGMRSDL